MDQSTEAKRIQLELDYPPSYNQQFTFLRGRPRLTRDAFAYRRHVRGKLILAKIKPLLGHVGIKIDAYVPDNRPRDCDNMQKPIIDALMAGGAFLDDSQIVLLMTIKRGVVVGGRIVVTLVETSKCDYRALIDALYSVEGDARD